MKKLVFIMALCSLNAFAVNSVNPNNNNCDSIQDPAERKDCFNIEKKNEAEENFKNFQENLPDSYQDDF
ncbi:hypothetical protein DGG96_02285 [Legionella qingyii]|uniref:Uncharacterized protein n=2 Tax=Legionella qingyii TaxID=2184757 RepID=A0A317U5F0_9GAMM|nr:hypothetical protein [Legionella qingyii]PWY56485.1 hypothetical protein DGG96_06905 [Legionella qingyii]PWY57158.1 hypothetical protein DGG96_02285 [Legionella qingyii]RUR25002.1 hypothetical protein ELY20_04390 [Legionella qingyii]RUR28726.1 hypothetical protein ELY16_01590 [Legionella qingyii]